jgi:hypothetical protein
MNGNFEQRVVDEWEDPVMKLIDGTTIGSYNDTACIIQQISQSKNSKDFNAALQALGF